MKLKVNVLQVPRIWIDSVEISFPLRRADALLFYIVCNKVAGRDELVSLLWDECDEQIGRRNLRNLIYVMKKHLGVDVLVTAQKNKLSLNPELELDCDYVKFMEQGDYMALHGPFLSGFGIKDSFTYDEWVDRVRERVKKQYLDCLSEQAQSTAQVGAVGRAERCALDYLRENPADEAMACFLMSIYQRQSRYFEAAQCYQHLHDYLEEELGILPMSETTQLYYKIMEEWNLATKEVPPLQADYIPASRQQFLRSMNHLYSQFSAGQPITCGLLLQGEAGVGKSFLLNRSLVRVEDAIFLVRASCFPSEQGHPYSLWYQLLPPLAAALEQQSVTLPERVQELVDTLSTLPGSADPTQIEQAACSLLVLAGNHLRLLLCIEDIQWADGPSIRLLLGLLRRFCQASLLCVMTARYPLPTDVAQLTSVAKDDRILIVQTIAPFTLDEVQALLQNIFDSKTAQEAVGFVYDATRGNPKLLNRLIHVPDSDTLSELRRGVKLLTEEQLQLLSPQGRRALDVLAAFSQKVSPTILCRLLELPYEKTEVVCTELCSAGFLEKRDGNMLVFRDDLLRLDIYRQQPLARRQSMHRTIARLLEEDGAFENSVIHYQLGDDQISALRVRSTYWERLLKGFCDQSIGEVRGMLFQEISGLRGAAVTGRALPEDLQGSVAQWMRLVYFLAALLSQRVGDAVAELMALTSQFSENWERSSSILSVLLRLLSQCAWESGCTRQLYEELTAITTDCGLIHLIRCELLSLDGRYSECEHILLPFVEGGHDAVLCAYGCYGMGLNRLRQGQQDATKWFQQAVAYVQGMSPFWGIARLYQEAGRSAMFASDDQGACPLFEGMLYLAVRTEDHASVSIAQAYLAMLSTSENQTAKLLRQINTEGASDFSRGILCLTQAQLRRRLERENSTSELLWDLVPEQVEFYCRRGLMFLSPLKDTQPECHALNLCLQGRTRNKQDP